MHSSPDAAILFLTHTCVGWKIPTRNSEEHDFTSQHI